MAFCPDSTATFSDSQLTEPYKLVVNPLIPAGGYADKPRTTDVYGLLTPTALTDIINKLMGSKIPDVPNFTLSGSVYNTGQNQAWNTYITNVELMKKQISEEYCFYDSRYRYAIRTLIALIADATSGATADLTRIRTLTDISISLNQKLTDISQIVNAITVHQYQNAQSMDTTINDLNGRIDSNMRLLRQQAEVLKSEAPAAELKKRMVEFTREKSLVSNNMLSFYFFMDVVALGILFYVYRAS